MFKFTQTAYIFSTLCLLTDHPLFYIHNFFKSTPKLVLVHLFTCLPLWIFLSPLSVSNLAYPIQKLFSFHFVQGFRNGAMLCLLKLSTSP